MNLFSNCAQPSGKVNSYCSRQTARIRSHVNHHRSVLYRRLHNNMPYMSRYILRNLDEKKAFLTVSPYGLGNKNITFSAKTRHVHYGNFGIFSCVFIQFRDIELHLDDSLRAIWKWWNMLVFFRGYSSEDAWFDSATAREFY